MPNRIGFDLRSLQIGHENRGIGMVIRSILENLNDSTNEYVFYYFDKNDPLKELGIKPTVTNYTTVTTPYTRTSIKKASDFIDAYKLMFHRFHELKNENLDVFVQFDASLGLPRWRSLKTFTFAYDLIPLIMKNEYLPSPLLAMSQKVGKKAKLKALIRAIYYKMKYNKIYSNLKSSRYILSISETTKKSLTELLKIRPSKIKVVPLAPVKLLSNSESNILDNIKKPYMFYIGGTDSRKRIEDIVYAFNICRSRGEDIALVLAGNEFREVELLPNIQARNAIIASPYKSDIHLVGFVSDSDKTVLYNNARAFVFASMYEGFGLPVIEAATELCPVVAYGNSSITEVIGDSALLVKTGSYESIARKVMLLADESLRNKYKKSGLEAAHKYTWEAHVNTLKKLLNA